MLGKGLVPLSAYLNFPTLICCGRYFDFCFWQNEHNCNIRAQALNKDCYLSCFLPVEIALLKILILFTEVKLNKRRAALLQFECVIHQLLSGMIFAVPVHALNNIYEKKVEAASADHYLHYATCPMQGQIKDFEAAMLQAAFSSNEVKDNN